MYRTMTCTCGKSLRIQPEQAGRKARCPGCGQICVLPPRPAALDEEAVAILLSAAPAGKAKSAKLLQSPSRPRIDNTPLPPNRQGPRPLPIVWRRKPRSEGRTPEQAPPLARRRIGGIRLYTLAAVLLMGLALVGLAVGCVTGSPLFILPPALLVIGVLAASTTLFTGG